MNVRVMTTNDLLKQWMMINTPREVADLIWDELLRRTRGELVAAPKGLVYEIVLVDGFKLVRLIRPRNPADIDHQFLETPPQPTDGLAFGPSDELDAATLAT